jgi:hypothetical protein
VLILYCPTTQRAFTVALPTRSEPGPAPATRVEVLSAHCQHPPAFDLHIGVTLGQLIPSGNPPPRMDACKRVELRNAFCIVKHAISPGGNSHGCQHSYASRIKSHLASIRCSLVKL